MNYSRWRRWLFRLDAERAHRWALRSLRWAQGRRWVATKVLEPLAHRDPRLATDVLGETFPAPVGLAAGFDKDAVAVRGFAALGAGFVEVGTVTPQPQPGNSFPRLFRHPAQRSLQNALGFPSAGMAQIRRNLGCGGARTEIPVGVNIGKNRNTPLEDSQRDYLALIEGLSAVAGFFVVNVSSPNTPGLTDLQDPRSLESLVRATSRATDCPLLVKLGPDFDSGRLVELASCAIEAGAVGIVATNTTVERDLLPEARERGGLSGEVLRSKSWLATRALGRAVRSSRLREGALLVSVGGVSTAEEVYRRLRAGASLVELYSALVFEGPGLFGKLHRGLLELMDRDGVDSVGEIVGVDA